MGAHVAMKTLVIAIALSTVCLLSAFGSPVLHAKRHGHGHHGVRHNFRASAARHAISARSLGRRLQALTTMVRAIESDEEEGEEEGEEEEEGGEEEEETTEKSAEAEGATQQASAQTDASTNAAGSTDSTKGAEASAGEEAGENDESDLAETNNSDLDKLHEPAVEPTVKLTAASKVPAEIRDAPMSGGEFRGIPGGVVDGTNITHLSYMIFKLIKKHEITSVVDMPCRNTLHWFPALLHRLDFEIVGFKYYCVDSEAHSQDDLRHLFGDAGQPEFMHIKPEEAAQLPKADLLFSWNGPQDWGVRKTWAFFNGIREIRPENLLITNNPGVSNANSNTGTLNVRKQPFHVRTTAFQDPKSGMLCHETQNSFNT